jgi:hypothetical protein
MQTWPERLLGYHLTKASHTGHLGGFNHEVRIEGKKSNQNHNDDADD